MIFLTISLKVSFKFLFTHHFWAIHTWFSICKQTSLTPYPEVSTCPLRSPQFSFREMPMCQMCPSRVMIFIHFGIQQAVLAMQEMIPNGITIPKEITKLLSRSNYRRCFDFLHPAAQSSCFHSFFPGFRRRLVSGHDPNTITGKL